jgi:hypothetical protein
MALLHRATLQPSKLELLQDWAPTQPWFDGDRSAELVTVAAYRFDDPEGEVGIETLLVRAGDGPVLQVPLTYRAAPLDGGDAWLIGTMQHSVLGQRWTYDGTGDPAYVVALATAILAGGHQAELFIEIDGEMTRREPTATVLGSGIPGTEVPSIADSLSTRNESGTTAIEARGLSLAVIRTLSADIRSSPVGSETLTGTWTDHATQTLLALALRA